MARAMRGGASSQRPASQSGEKEVADYMADPGPVGPHIMEDILGYWASESTKARFPGSVRRRSPTLGRYV